MVRGLKRRLPKTFHSLLGGAARKSATWSAFTNPGSKASRATVLTSLVWVGFPSKEKRDRGGMSL